MRVLLDACIDPGAASVFTAHNVRTAFQLNWDHLADHVLLDRA